MSKKKRSRNFRKKPTRPDTKYNSWSEVDWRKLGYASFAAFYAAVNRGVERTRAEKQKTWREEQRQTELSRDRYHQLRLKYQSQKICDKRK